MVSVHSAGKVLKLTNKKYCLSDESVLKKIERFLRQGVERDFFINGKRIAKITPRLTGLKDAQKWLSMQPNPLRWHGYEMFSHLFGEVNENNRMNGRGIDIYNDDRISIGYFEDGSKSTGNYIIIYSSGKFDVGEIYNNDGERCDRCTTFETNGSE